MAMEKHFNKILIANRGEVAVRIIQACNELNIATVAVYSDADKRSLHVIQADEAAYLGQSAAANSYLNQDRVLAAAKLTGADAIHPGFGFLSENAGFAERCHQENITFIGPNVDAMTTMASKSLAKDLVEKLNIPVIPGNNSDDQSLDYLVTAAAEIGYPILIKASAGGGGMGMRVVECVDDFEGALFSAKREARSAFDDDHILLEKYFTAIRHIEVQLVADAYGEVLHCYERECSVQRRRQKVVEEAPSPSISEKLRQKLTTAAVKIAKDVNYVGLGTIEFIVEDKTDNFYFLEMNTRLQVEHGITEAITGLDLVKMQIKIAEGQALNLKQSDIVISGHAIECRLYAEDPNSNFSPATGKVLFWQPHQSEDTRIDNCIRAGSEISPFYDPMIAKLITHSDDRKQARRAMLRCLENTKLLGVQSNQHFLHQVICHPAFVSGDTTTDFIERFHQDLLQPLSVQECHQLLLVAAMNQAQSQMTAHTTNEKYSRDYRLQLGDQTYQISVEMYDENSGTAHIDGQSFEMEVLNVGKGGALNIAIDGLCQSYVVAPVDGGLFVCAPLIGSRYLDILSRFSVGALKQEAGGYYTAMPGRIVEVLAKVGQKVKAGDKLITMESMKMEHTTLAASDGVVRKLFVAEEDLVEKKTLLIEIEPLETSQVQEKKG